MSGDIRPRTERKAFRSMSTSSMDYENESSICHGNNEHSPPSSCPGNIPSSYMSIHTYHRSLQNLKEAIMVEVQQNCFHPIIDILHRLDADIQSIKWATNQSNPNAPETSDKVVRAECEISACGTSQPKCILCENMDSDQIDEDLSNLPPRQLQTQSIDNQMSGCTGRAIELGSPCNDSHLENKQRQRNEYDNVIVTKPKEVRSNSLRTRVKQVAVQPRPRSAVHINKAPFDERECLANALQFHIEDLVDGIVFQESELPDYLLVEGCLTEDECATVRKLRDRKDQIRILLSLIKGRDIRVLRGFLKHIKQHNPDVAEKVNTKFEINKRNGLRGKVCILCQLMKQFNVKHVADSLWAIQAINDELYNRIIYCETPVGAQSDLWKEVVSSLNCLDTQNAGVAHKKLINALAGKNLFTHLADGISNTLIKNHGMLICACEPKFIPSKGTSVLGATNSGESFFPDSSSDSTSNDFTSFELGTEYGDMQDRRLPDTVDGMSRITEITEDPISQSSILSNMAPVNKTSLQENDNLPNSYTPALNPKPDDKPECGNDATQIKSPNKPNPPKKPLLANKRPVPSKKPEIVPAIAKTSTGTSLPNTTALERVVDADVPPLPERKNKRLAMTIQN